VSTPDKPPAPVELSIGTLSSATGVPVDTLRTWERRYGFPVPIGRTEGSHRRYAADTIERIQLIVRALDLGHRPSAVVGRDPVELRRLVGSPAALGAEPRGPGTGNALISHWLELTRDMDGSTLIGEFHRSLAEMAVIPFLEQRLGPYLQALGEHWSRGLIRVSHEHFASEKMREFLSAQWRGASEGSAGTRAAAVLATPSGEQHALGLHMAAWVIALAGTRVIFLGADTPVDEVAYATERNRARGVALSVAAGYAGDLPRYLTRLSALLASDVRLALGGTGSRVAGPFDQYLNGFEALFEWASGLGAELDPSASGH
jgi:methylmalonyl-CoA mutase cobalamin-binding subunit